MKRVGLIFSLLLALTACEKALSEKEFANVLSDMYLYEEFRGNDLRLDSVSIYRSVFRKYGCTEEEFNRSVKKYTADPKKLKKVYEIVNEQLKVRKEVPDAIISEKLKIKQEQEHLDSLYRYPADTSYRYFFDRCALELEGADSEIHHEIIP